MSNLIIGLTQHQNLGTLLIPYLTEKESKEIIRVEEQATSATLSDSSLTKVEKEIIRLSLCYSEKNLMKAYSKEKIVSTFLRKLTDEQLKKTIRPFIDKNILEIIQLMRQHKIPFYHKETGKQNLYNHNQIKLKEQDTETVFHFESTDLYFRYSITCKTGEDPVNLTEMKPIIILTAKPACIMAKDELLVFSDIEATRLTPFFKKKFVEVPASMTEKYMKQIVLPAVKHFQVEVSGFDITEDKTQRRAELSIEKSESQEQLLNLCFRYNDRCFAPEVDNLRKDGRVEETNGKFNIRFIARDVQWEKKCIDKLISLGLEQVSDLQFVLHETAPKIGLQRWIGINKNSFQKTFELNQLEVIN